MYHLRMDICIETYIYISIEIEGEIIYMPIALVWLLACAMHAVLVVLACCSWGSHEDVTFSISCLNVSMPRRNNAASRIFSCGFCQPAMPIYPPRKGSTTIAMGSIYVYIYIYMYTYIDREISICIYLYIYVHTYLYIYILKFTPLTFFRLRGSYGVAI